MDFVGECVIWYDKEYRYGRLVRQKIKAMSSGTTKIKAGSSGTTKISKEAYFKMKYPPPPFISMYIYVLWQVDEDIREAALREIAEK